MRPRLACTTATHLVAAGCMLDLLPPSSAVGVVPSHLPTPCAISHPANLTHPPLVPPTPPTLPARLQVNKKVMQMFEKAEQEYNELKRKKDVVEADKSRIQQVGSFSGRGGVAWEEGRLKMGESSWGRKYAWRWLGWGLVAAGPGNGGRCRPASHSILVPCSQ